MGEHDDRAAQYALDHHAELEPPYAGALYENVRSGKEWQVYSWFGRKLGGWGLRQERRLLGGFGWFRFLFKQTEDLQDEKRWRYVGPTPKGHYLWGYDLGNPRERGDRA